MAEEREILLKIEVDKSQSQKELEGVTTQLLENKKAVQELNGAYKQGSVTTDQYVKESLKLKGEQKSLTEQQKQLTKEVNAESNSLNALRNNLAKLTKERNELNQGTKEGAKRFNELQKEIAETTDKIKKQEQAGGDFRRNVGNYGSVLKEAAGGVQIMGNSLDGLFKLIVSNPIGLIITALFGLFKILSQNEEIATFFKGVMTGLGFIFDKLAGIIGDAVTGLGLFGGETSKLGALVKDVGTRILNSLLAPLNFIIDILPAVSAAMEGEFSKAANIAGDASVKFGKSVAFMNDEVPKLVEVLGDAVDAGKAYEKALNDIEDAQSDLNVVNARSINERDKLLLQSKDLSKSEKERIALSEQASKIDEEILKSKLEIIQRSIDAERNHLANISATGNEADEVRHKINDLLVEQLNAENESLKFQEKQQNKRNALIEKELANKQKLAEAEKKRLEDDKKAKEKAEEEEEKLNQRKRDAIVKLNEHKLKEEIKTNEQLLENENITGEERVSILSGILEKEKQIELDKRNFLLENDALTTEERKLIHANYQGKIRDLEKETQEIIREDSDKTTELQELNQQKALDVTSDTLGNVAGLFEKHTVAFKAIASTQALIDTYKSANASFASAAEIPVVGPILAPIAAAAAIAAGFANVAKINAAAGGGDFVTTKPTLLLVGDNPGARERVTVTPLSGKGKTTVHPGSGMIAMAGGGSLTSIGASLTNTRGIDDNVNISSLLSAFQNMPTPVVSVKEITNRTDRVKVKETVKNL
jgi:hypothetical protein